MRSAAKKQDLRAELGAAYAAIMAVAVLNVLPALVGVLALELRWNEKAIGHFAAADSLGALLGTVIAAFLLRRRSARALSRGRHGDSGCGRSPVGVLGQRRINSRGAIRGRFGRWHCDGGCLRRICRVASGTRYCAVVNWPARVRVHRHSTALPGLTAGGWAGNRHLSLSRCSPAAGSECRTAYRRSPWRVLLNLRGRTSRASRRPHGVVYSGLRFFISGKERCGRIWRSLV